jgi:hypothetical protein
MKAEVSLTVIGDSGQQVDSEGFECSTEDLDALYQAIRDLPVEFKGNKNPLRDVLVTLSYLLDRQDEREGRERL